MADIQKLSVFDPRIVQERPAFAVDKGAMSLTNSPFNAISATASQMSFNIQVPSLNVFIDREILWTATCLVSFNVALTATGAVGGIAINTPICLLGRDVSLAPYPLHSTCGTMTATINDAVSTINTQDVLYEVVRMVDRKGNRLAKSAP